MIKRLAALLGIALAEKMLFTRHLAVMIKAGLPLNQSLKTLSQQSKSEKLKKIIALLEQDIRQGQTFSQALEKHPTVFNNLYVNMVKAGEASGSLSESLNILAEQMKKDHELIGRVRSAMTYPAVIVLAMIGIGVFMLATVVPKLNEVFVELKIELPLSTRIIIGFSNFLQDHFVIGLLIFVALAVSMRFALRDKRMKKPLHFLFLNFPILGKLTRKINAARFAGTLGSLIQSGIDIVKALSIVSGTLTNQFFKESLENTSREVQKGTILSKALTPYETIYTPMVIQMIKVGEETGSLTDILKDLAEFYQEDIDNTTKSLSSIIEPIIMIVIGAAVGFFAVSMIQPMYSMMGGV